MKTKVHELKIGSLLFFIAAILAISFSAVHYNVPAKTVPIFVCDEIALPHVKVQAKPIVIAQEKTEVLAPIPAKAMPLPIVPPKVIHSVNPVYPVGALKQGISGIVIVEAVIDSSGKVLNPKIKMSSANAELDNSALAAVSQWEFSPAMQGSQSINSEFEVPVRFVLSN